MSRKYTCANCSKQFSRKWNANRHNNDVHSGTSIVFNNESRIPTDDKKLYFSYVAGKDDPDEADQQIILDLFGRMLQNFEKLEN